MSERRGTSLPYACLPYSSLLLPPSPGTETPSSDTCLPPSLLSGEEIVPKTTPSEPSVRDRTRWVRRSRSLGEKERFDGRKRDPVVLPSVFLYSLV